MYNILNIILNLIDFFFNKKGGFLQSFLIFEENPLKMLFKDIKKWLLSYANNSQNGFALKRTVLLASMICSLIRSGRASLQKIGEHLTDDTQLASRITKAKRFLKNKHINTKVHFIPYLSYILKSLASSGQIILAVDGSSIGKDCSVLMINVIWKSRAIPIAWLIRQAPKGHFPEEMHIDIVNQAAAILKPYSDQKCKVVFLGDGEFDGAGLQQTIKNHDWFYVLKTSKKTYISEQSDMKDACKIADNIPNRFCKHLMIENQYIGKHEKYGLVNVVIWHDLKHKNPLYLLTNLEYAPDATKYYAKRFTIETFFGDIKTRGFNITHTKIDNVKMLSNLLLIACLSFIISIMASYYFKKSKQLDRFCIKHKIHQLSIFQIGFRGLRYFFSQNLSIKLDFQIFKLNCVR